MIALNNHTITMKYIANIILFLALVLGPKSVFGGDEGKANAGPGVTVLIYHRFGDDRYPTTNVPTENFKKQMAYLKENNFQVISLEKMVQAITSQKPLPDKAVAITIDDGYKSIYDVAWPILKSYDYPFTVFLYTRATDKNYSDILSWDEVLEMKASGVDFQDHSFSHHRLGDWPKSMDERTYREWIRKDLEKSRSVIEEKLGVKPKFFAIPYGEYNSIVLEEAISQGYQAIFSQDPGSVSLDSDVMLIPREPILGNEWVTLDHFKKILHRVDLPITEMEPPPSSLSHPLVQRFGCRLKDVSVYVPGTLGIYVSGLGWHQATVEGNYIYIDNEKPLVRKLSRVTVSGKLKESGRLAMRTWLLIQRPEK